MHPINPTPFLFLTPTANDTPPTTPSTRTQPINQAHAARLGLTLHGLLERARRRLLPRLRLALRLPVPTSAPAPAPTAALSSSRYARRASSLDLITDVVLALRSLEPAAGSPTDSADDDDANTVPATTLYAPWAKAQAWLPSWAPLLPLPCPDSLLASTSAHSSSTTTNEDPWRVSLRARMWVKKGVAGDNAWGLLVLHPRRAEGGEGVVVVGEEEGGGAGVWVVEPVGEGSDAFRYVL